MSQDKYTCPCCGHKIFREDKGSNDICPVCRWEDDIWQLKEPYEEMSPNGVSLFQAQKNCFEFGACDQDSIRYARKPLKDEPKDENWKPLT